MGSIGIEQCRNFHQFRLSAESNDSVKRYFKEKIFFYLHSFMNYFQNLFSVANGI